MKKLFLVLFVIIGSVITVNAQTTIKYINGIPSTQDIGGVDVDQPVCFYATPNNPIYEKLVFTNYNQFPVTVLYEYGTLTNGGYFSWSVVGTIVLPPASNGKYPSKEVEYGKGQLSKLDVVTITRKVGN